MKLSQKSIYALRALARLAMHPEQGNVRAQELADRERMPLKFLEHILLLLTNGGVLSSRRGVGGGYALTRSADQISLGDVMRLTEGPLDLVSCKEPAGQEACHCIDADTCGLRDAMREVATAFAGSVDGISLAEVCERTQDLQQEKAQTFIYSI